MPFVKTWVPDEDVLREFDRCETELQRQIVCDMAVLSDGIKEVCKELQSIFDQYDGVIGALHRVRERGQIDTSKDERVRDG